MNKLLDYIIICKRGKVGEKKGKREKEQTHKNIIKNRRGTDLLF